MSVASTASRRFYTALKLLLAALLLVLQVYPIIYVVSSSLKSAQEFGSSAPWALPQQATFENYLKVFTTSRMPTYFKNSIIITAVTLVFLLAFSSMAAFALSKIKFKGRGAVLSYFLFGLMLPTQVALIPLFFIFSRFDMLNTYAAIIIPQLAFALSYSIHLFTSFYKFLPNDVIEAGIIDGCGPMGCFVRIVLPMSSNSILTVATMQGVFCWNEFICAYTFTRSVDMKTVTLGLQDFVGMYGLTDWGATFAAIVITVLPTFIFYFCTSKYMMAGLTAGSVKG